MVEKNVGESRSLARKGGMGIKNGSWKSEGEKRAKKTGKSRVMRRAFLSSKALRYS